MAREYRANALDEKKFYFPVDKCFLWTIMVDVKSQECSSFVFSKSMAGVGLSVTLTALHLVSVTTPRPPFFERR
jgi:hypothetical protein